MEAVDESEGRTTLENTEAVNRVQMIGYGEKTEEHEESSEDEEQKKLADKNEATNLVARHKQSKGKQDCFKQLDFDARVAEYFPKQSDDLSQLLVSFFTLCFCHLALWSLYNSRFAGAASSLCEQLRIILEPTVKNKLHGDFKTGKKLSMRKVVSFVASNFRKDRIWLRRSHPDRRDYRVIVALDNSRSMSELGVCEQALQAICLVCQAFQRLEIGKTGVCAFGGLVS